MKVIKMHRKNKKVRSEKSRRLNINIVLFVIGLFLIIFSYIYESFAVKSSIFLLASILGFVLCYFSVFRYFNIEKNNFLKSLEFIKKCKNYLLFVILFFLLMAFIGYNFQIPEISEVIKKIIQELVDKTKELNFIEMLWFIFRNNLSVAFFSVIFGIFFGIFPFLTVISNGYVLGFVAEKSVSAIGVFSLIKLFPHGIFELPAIFISLAFGLKLGMFVFSKDPGKYLKNIFKESMRAFVFVIVPLLLIAAIIETVLIFLV